MRSAGRAGLVAAGSRPGPWQGRAGALSPSVAGWPSGGATPAPITSWRLTGSAVPSLWHRLTGKPRGYPGKRGCWLRCAGVCRPFFVRASWGSCRGPRDYRYAGVVLYPMESHGIERHKAIWKGNYFYSGMLAKTRRAYSDFLLQTQRGVMPSKFAFFFLLQFKSSASNQVYRTAHYKKDAWPCNVCPH